MRVKLYQKDHIIEHKNIFKIEICDSKNVDAVFEDKDGDKQWTMTDLVLKKTKKLGKRKN